MNDFHSFYYKQQKLCKIKFSESLNLIKKSAVYWLHKYFLFYQFSLTLLI
ncbi:hypothetical protein BMWSH_4381 [Priestia megaterium WSH-002]|uniref:Uncharacterized protein n=1 Tax=Priestia megaterium (strain WSH-002) TaxID=1006007 RepID=A0A8D3X5B9_PRIMW|nr:hypothetical protein BMWSH_4381 [Priestia megaterium WSH-002]